MRSARVVLFLVAATAAVATPRAASAVNVNVSMNVFPTNTLNPNGGGTWTLVAKTDSPHGIEAINIYVLNVNIAGLALESDIGADSFFGGPFIGVFNGAINLGYFQNPVLPASVVLGVGTLATSDGPDPLGDPLWNNATRIMSGAYASTLPVFTTAGANSSDANTFSTSVPPFNAAVDADSTFVVRVFVPEPSGIVGGLTAIAGLIAARRRL